MKTGNAQHYLFFDILIKYIDTKTFIQYNNRISVFIKPESKEKIKRTKKNTNNFKFI